MSTNMDQDTEPDRKRKRTSDTPTQLPIRSPKSMFQMCSDVLDQYPQVTIEQMNQRRKKMRGEYQGKKVVDYTSEITHCAYIRTDVTFHTDALSQMLKRLYWGRRDFQSLFSISENFESALLTVASIGCGPGTDMLGVLRFVDKIPGLDHDDLPFFHFALFDLNPGWRKAVGHFKDVIKRNVNQNVGNSFKTSFVPWSLTQDPSTRVIHPSLKVADLFIFSWVLSDVLRGSTCDSLTANRVKDNLNGIGAGAKCGAYFMFLDTNYKSGRNTFCMEEFLEETVIASPMTQDFFYHVCSMDGDYQLDFWERKEDLGKYYDKSEQPKFKKRPVTVRVYQKILPTEQW